MANAIDLKGIVERIETRLKELRMSERAAGEAMGKPEAIRNIRRALEAGKENYSPRANTLAEIAAVLKTTPDWIQQGDEAAAPQPLRSGYKPPPQFISDSNFTLPVFSSAEGGAGALILSHDPIERQQPPASLEGATEAYGILFTGESMSPAIKPGQIGWVDPRLPPMNGEEHVFVSSREDLGEERAMVKDLVKVSKAKWRVHQWNPEREFDLDRREWQKCHRIVAKFNRR